MTWGRASARKKANANRSKGEAILMMWLLLLLLPSEEATPIRKK